MASSSVYISVIEGVVGNVREDFIAYGVGDAVLNELQALWKMKMLHISGNIDRSRAPAASAGGAPGAGATPTADMLFPPTPIQTPLPGEYSEHRTPTPAAATPRPRNYTWEGEDDDEPPLDEDDDDDDECDEDNDEPNTQHLVLAQFEKVTRANNRWKCALKGGIMHLNGRDVLFNKASGEFDF